MTKLTLTQVTRTQRTSKDGKPFTSLTIKANEYGQKFLSGFGNKANENWKEGDVVEVENIVEKPGVNKKGEAVVYLNFEMPKAQAVTPGFDAKVLTEIANGITTLKLNQQKIIDHLSGKSRLDITSAGTKVPDFSEDG
jgi:hypothetical protein